MIAPAPDAPLIAFERAVRETRAQYDDEILRVWDQVQRFPHLDGLRLRLARLLEPHVRDTEDNPPVVLGQPGWDSDVHVGSIDVGIVVDTGVPCRFIPDHFREGGVTIVAGGSRTGKSTFILNLLRGHLQP